MTDDRHDRTAETPDDDATAGDARWFRAAVDPVVGGPVPDAWTAIRDRATGAAPTVVPLAPVNPGRTTRPWVLMAAALVAFAAVAGTVFALVARDDDQGTVMSDVADGPTGFYVPTNLPDGWEVGSFGSSVDTIWSEWCPCEFTEWRSGRRILSATRTTEDVDVSGDSFRPWDGAPGGRRAVTDGTVVYTWRSDGLSTSIRASGFDDEAATDRQAEVWVADGRTLTGPDGFERTSDGTIDTNVRGIIAASGTLENPALGLSVHFRLRPDPLGWDTAAGSTAVETVQLDGSGLTVLRPPDDPRSLRGRWPGDASFAISDCFEDCHSDTDVTAAQIEALAATFRPATAREWRAFVDEHGGTYTGERRDPRARKAAQIALVRPRLADFVIRDGQPLPDEELGPDPDFPAPPPEGEKPPTPPTSPAPETDKPSLDVPSTTGLARQPVPDLTSDGTPSNLYLHAVPDSPVEVQAGETFRLRVDASNPSDTSISVRSCFPSGAQWRLQQDGAPVGPVGHATASCADDATFKLAPGASVPFGLSPGGFVFSTLSGGSGCDPLPPGRYQAVVEFDGVPRPATVEVTINAN